MMRLLALLLTVATGVTLALPVSAQEDRARIGNGNTVLELRSTTDVAIIRPALEAFVEQNPQLSIEYEQWGSNALYSDSLAACAGEEPSADAVFSSAVHQMVALVNSACAQDYQSEATLALPSARRWRNQLWGVTEEPAVIIYNSALLAEENVPRTRFALLDLMRNTPLSLAGRIATYDIEASGLGYLFAYNDSLEATTFGAMLEGFARTQAVATCCSAEIIGAVAEGRFLLAYNVLGSYVANAAPADVGVILPEDYTLFLTRGYMIPRQARQPQAAGRLLDFLLSTQGQTILRRAGLIYAQDPEETALLPSARRAIALAPPLLVALDRSKSAQFRTLWRTAFAAIALP